MKLVFDALVISSFWFMALYTLNLSNIKNMVINFSDNYVYKKAIFIAKGFIIIWILTELSLLINENSVVFLIIRDLINTSVISHIIFAANLLVLFNVSIVMSGKLLESVKYIIKVEKNAIIFSNGMLVIALSILIFYFQCVYWGELNYVYTSQGEVNIFLEAIVDGIFIFIPAIIIIINTIRFLKKEKIRGSAIRISIPVIIFISFAQSIISKIIVIYYLIKRFQKYILKHIGKEIEITYKDPLLIASSISEGNVNAKINAYYLTAYFFAILILWTLQVSPFPINKNLYENGTVIIVFMSFAIIFFWLLEEAARLSGCFGNYFRWLFIPGMLLLTVFPFYTDNANINSIIKINEIMSLYHKMAFALGDNKYLFFLCLTVIQGSIAYIFHLITGEAHNDRHYYSVMPIVFIIQLLILAVMFPIILSVPPYTLKENTSLIIFIFLIIGITLTLSIGKISYHMFTSKSSDWSSYVNDYWKDKQRIYILVFLITVFSFTPLASIVINSINNKNIVYVSEYNYNTNDSYKAKELIKGFNDEIFYILEGNGQDSSKLLAASMDDGSIKWVRTYSSEYNIYKIWSNNTIVLVKTGNRGFTIISLKTGKEVYDYTVDLSEEIEFLNIEVNDRAVLMTYNETQTLYDRDYGEIKLDILGNNFYELIQGNQCALQKNNKVFIYRNNRLETVLGVYDFSQTDFIYYDENGMIVFNINNIVRYSYSLQEKDNKEYLKLFDRNTIVEAAYYQKYNNLIAFYMYGRNKYYAYEFDTVNFTYKIVPLEQKIKDMRDLQALILCDDKGLYLFYDDYQVTLFEHENLIARQWYQLPLNKNNEMQEEKNVVGSPIYVKDKIAWLDYDGILHVIMIKKS